MRRPAVSKHLKSIFEAGELQEDVVCSILEHATFERWRIQEMMRDFPQYATPLKNIIDRMKDLIHPFQKKHYTTEALGRKYSIKLVLPAFCPDVSYKELEINNGLDASSKFLNLYYCPDETVIADTRHHLLNIALWIHGRW